MVSVEVSDADFVMLIIIVSSALLFVKVKVAVEIDESSWLDVVQSAYVYNA